MKGSIKRELRKELYNQGVVNLDLRINAAKARSSKELISVIIESLEDRLIKADSSLHIGIKDSIGHVVDIQNTINQVLDEVLAEELAYLTGDQDNE